MYAARVSRILGSEATLHGGVGSLYAESSGRERKDVGL